MGCLYGGNQCACWGGTWHCNACPTSAPSSGSCTTGWACNYGSTACGCDYMSPSWSCLTCPTTKPGDETSCNSQSAVCAYGNGFCRCRWNSSASAMRWDCP
ncbi:MAG: hypothetical protein DYH12_36305 [Sorangiineae bacterium PRO1]|nr:hypothetical protein [Sorangiineae bacterium PRO1]